jgi:AGZA family xanthine/uracil permease-like MFS transporter
MKSSFGIAIDNYFQISERGSSLLTEFRAGTVTFLTMCYILLVNPQVLAISGLDPADVVVATAAASAFGSFICGIGANLPFGLAPGLGLSAYFSYGMVQAAGMSWEEALTACLVSSILSLCLAVLKVGDMIMRVIPECIKMATVVGMGLLLTFIGFANVDLVVRDEHALVKIGSLSATPVLLCLLGLAIIASLQHKEIKGGILIGIISITIISWALDGSWPEQFISLPSVKHALMKVDLRTVSPKMIPAIFAFLAIQIFDVSGCMFGVAQLANLVNERNEVEGGAWALGSASAASILASIFGCTPIIVHLECAAGVKEGGRTGLSGIVTSFWFLLSLFFAPLFAKVPAAATSPVVVFVGACMMELSSKIDWQRIDQAVPAFITLVVMPFTFSIADGIFLGMAFSFIFFITTGELWNYLPWRRPRQRVRTVLQVGTSDKDDENGLTQSLLDEEIANLKDRSPSPRTPNLILNKATIAKLSPTSLKSPKFFTSEKPLEEREEGGQTEEHTQSQIEPCPEVNVSPPTS